MVTSRRGQNQAQLRESNLSTVLRYVYDNPALSRSQLATRTKLNKSTVSSLIAELLELRLIKEAGFAQTGGGRPARLLKPNPEAGDIIGIELDADHIRAVLADFTGRVHWQQREAVARGAGRQLVLTKLQEIIDVALTAGRARGLRLLGVGLTLPGMVDVEGGVLLYSPNLQLRNLVLGPALAEQTQLPTFVENDANAAAVGERLFGSCRLVSDFIFIVTGVGVGGGLFLNGRLYRGAGLAGEIGHMRLGGGANHPCRCGSRGCWENSANEDALKARVQALLTVGRKSQLARLPGQRPAPLTPALIVQAAAAQDAVALAALGETGAAIGAGVANLVNIFDPECVIIGGGLSEAGEQLLPVVRQAVETQALPELRRHVQVRLSVFGADAIVMGAVALVVAEILDRPTRVRAIPLQQQPTRGGAPLR
ncbi:MAG: ROK family transcriptional regulator [Candidatus Promineifilaceae bacterium]|nr:ROK family transcriptional regulator [Candidatus Promineifilaceae bacterium]